MKYLLITFVRKPGGQIDEQVTVSHKVRKSDQSMCNIILDFHSKTVEKCVIDGNVIDTDWDKIIEYYRGVYPTLVGELERSAPGWEESPPTTESAPQPTPAASQDALRAS